MFPRSRANPFAWLVELDAVDYEFVIDELQYPRSRANPFPAPARIPSRGSEKSGYK